MPLTDEEMVSFLATSNAMASRLFFENLGLKLVEETDFAVVFAGANGQLRIQKVEAFVPHPYTVLGWKVNMIENAVTELTAKGVIFERYDRLSQDSSAIWSSPSGAKIAWLKDPDGNLISLTQY